MRPALSDYRHLASGKVRELYRIDDEHLLFVATDRISAFDHILDNEIPDKGRILTAMSVFFFDYVEAPNHLAGPPDDERIPQEVLGRALVVQELEMLPVEAVARGYLTGSGLIDYQKTGAVCGIALPPGLQESDRLEQPLFAPSTKADEGHDENISFDRMAEIVGADRAAELRSLSLELYSRARAHAEGRGIILADTKLEFGARDGRLVWIDEAFTPDSSRFWPQDGYAPGRPQPSFDKQFVRDYRESIAWDKRPPAPPLPADVVARTREKYVDAYARLTGRELSRATATGAGTTR